MKKNNILVSIPQAVSAVATNMNRTFDAMGEGFNTASGKCCCNLPAAASPSQIRSVSIPQAVSAVATPHYQFLIGEYTRVSIPQAVSAVATVWKKETFADQFAVSIPQAVSAVATAGSRKPVFIRFQKLVLENLKP